MTIGLPPSLVGTPWDTPEGRAKYARITEDLPTVEELQRPEAWERQTRDLVEHADPDAIVGDVAQALADAFAAGYRAGELA
jgi:hypothetical protein